MNKTDDYQLIQKFRERVDREELTGDIKVVYRLAGGMPDQRVEEEYIVSGDGAATVKVQDKLSSRPYQEISAELDREETINIFRKIETGLDSLVPRSEARFLPDSVIGSITIEVERETTTLYFLAEEGERFAQNKPISPQMTEALQQLSKTSQRLLRKMEGKDNE